nr:MAG TPA: hypothetical protein [Caudoviricetes sp.]
MQQVRVTYSPSPVEEEGVGGRGLQLLSVYFCVTRVFLC